MNIAIASSVVTAIVDHARAAAPNEACGILFGETGSDASRITSAEPAANVAAHPTRAFEIDPAALLRAHREARGQGRTVVGWYHSHPNGIARPSAADAARAVEDGKLWLIAGVGEGATAGAGESVTSDGATKVTLAAWRTVADGPVRGRFAPVELVTG